MNDDQLLSKVRESFADVRLDVPLAQTVQRGRALRRRGSAYRVASVAGVAAIAGVAAVAVTGPGRGGAPGTASPHPGAVTTLPGLPRPSASAVAGTGTGTGSAGTKLDAWTVTRDPNGLVNVTIRQLFDAAGLQRALRADRVPARVTFAVGVPSDTPPLPPGCTMVAMSDEANAKLQAKILPMTPPSFNNGIALTIDTRQIPAGVGIYLAVQPPAKEPNGGTDWSWGLDLVQTATSCTG